MSKWIVWKNGIYDERIDTVKKAEENLSLRSRRLSTIKLIWAILTEKGFKWKFEETLKYALIHYDCYKGSNASDVFIFTCTKNYSKIWKEKNV